MLCWISDKSSIEIPTTYNYSLTKSILQHSTSPSTVNFKQSKCRPIICKATSPTLSGDLNTEQLNPGKIWMPNILGFRYKNSLISNGPFFKSDIKTVWFQMVRFSKRRVIAIVQTIQKPDHLKSGHFCSDFKCFLTKWQPFVQS